MGKLQTHPHMHTGTFQTRPHGEALVVASHDHG
jgi:hypothetical protein